jgi:hypothetical protein
LGDWVRRWKQTTPRSITAKYEYYFGSNIYANGNDAFRKVTHIILFQKHPQVRRCKAAHFNSLVKALILGCTFSTLGKAAKCATIEDKIDDAIYLEEDDS